MRTPPGPRRPPTPPPRTRGRSRRRTPARACRRRSGVRISGTVSRKSSSPRSRMPTRSASASASARSCVQSRIVASCAAPHLADELLHLELRARVEARRRLVEQEQHRRGQQRPRERDLLLHAAREVLHRLVAAVGREADAGQDPRDLHARLARPHAVVARRVVQVLAGGHLLEEARLDRDAVDELAHRPRLGEDVVPEHACAAAVVEEQRREQPDERRLARAVLAQDRDALAPLAS